MATEGSQPMKLSLVASGDLSASQYRFVKQDANGQAAAISAATDIAVGILQNKPTAAGQMAEIVVVGRSKVVSAGSIAIGAQVGPDSTGKAQSVSLAQYAGTYTQGTKKAYGYLQQTAAASTSDVCSVVVSCIVPASGT